MAHANKKTLEANALKFFALVKKQAFASPRVTITAENNFAFSVALQDPDDESAAGIQSKLDKFLDDHPVAMLQIEYDALKPAESKWTLHRLHFVVEVPKKPISKRQLKHFAQVPDVGIVAMASSAVCCKYDADLGQFTALEDIVFDDLIATPFFAGKYRCVRNEHEIQVTGPSKKGDRKVVWRKEADPKRGRTIVVGFHVWDKSSVILVLSVPSGMQIYTIDTKTDKVTLQETEFQGTQSQVAQAENMAEQGLFVLSDKQITWYKHGPGGFFKFRTLVGFVQEPFLARAACFCVGQYYLCVGADFFVSLYDMADVVLTESAVVTLEARMHVACHEPNELFYADPGTNRELLVSSQEGVQLWTLE